MSRKKNQLQLQVDTLRDDYQKLLKTQEASDQRAKEARALQE